MADGIILDIDFAQAQCSPQVLRPNQRGVANLLADSRRPIEWQQVRITPHGEWPALNQLPCDLRPGGVIVLDLKRPEAQLTDMDRCFVVLLAAFAAA